MKQINIIDKVKLTHRGLMLSSSQQPVHLRQGEMDGACAVYSMMMCLIMEKIIKRNLITDTPTNLKRNTSDGRLVRFFLEKQGMVIGGYFLSELQRDLQSAFKRKVDTYRSHADQSNIVEEIIDWLDDNHPVEIAFSRKRGVSGHALVAIGYQRDEKKTTFFCLDPGYPMEECQLWNNVLKIDTTSTAKYNCLNMKEHTKVWVDEMMVFLKK